MATTITDYLAQQKPSTNTVVATNATSTQDAAKKSLASNYTTFLTLLTSQLKNQDPLKPMDTDSFTQQLTQMTGVQQQLLTNDLLQTLVTNSSSNSNLNAVSLIGKTVTATTTDANLKSGAATWNYTLPTAAKDAAIEITNAKGAVVWKGTAPSLDSGAHDFTWNGADATGAALADGVYTMKVTAHDTANTLLTVPTTTTGLATALQQASGVTQLLLGGVKVNIGDIQGVRDQTATT
jgi:flagellar basal-body rod modification protein FlgD